MYATSSQKKDWTFTSEEIALRRKNANNIFRAKHKELLSKGEEELFLNPEDELIMQRIVEDAATRFADKFRPHIWPSVKWTAYAYFKRLFLDWSASESSPKIVIMACFYLAMKTDEFYVTIDEFVSNLSTGSPEQNTSRILGLEPEIMRSLNYNLTVHAPYRPFEGHLMEMKTRMVLLAFDLETIRNDAFKFFDKALQTDVMMMFSPSQISLAAIKYGLVTQGKSPDILKEFLAKLFGVEDNAWGSSSEGMKNVVKLMERIEVIINTVEEDFMNINDADRLQLQKRAGALTELMSELTRRRSEQWKANGSIGKAPGDVDEQPVDSDDE
ncbi:unnamed protein product [Caenorhabditis auriculariae]|uniref:Cyclin-H n=1 Tax=Caenorhabditis auriculariae TaxID=2777116 RepID=A0A8S1HQB3_9PELO|nr:unnamed protein product [Caenorhabditis auriculariae]